VYVSSLAAGVPQVFLVWRARPGLPEASSTGAGLVLSEFRAEVDQQLIEKKVLPGTGTAVEAVDVRGSPGFWISGRPHLLVFLDEFGRVIEDQVRLAGNVLLWEAGEVTLRLEAAITREVAVRIAETVR
jgi:hypothetical protein